MRRVSLYFFMAVLCATNSLAVASTVSRTFGSTNKISELQSENSAVKNRATRESVSETRTVSRAPVNTRQSAKSDVVSRSAVQNTNVVSRGVQRNANESSVNVVSRSGRTDANIVHRARVATRSESGEPTLRSRQNNSPTRAVQERAATLNFGTRQQITPTAESIASAKDFLQKSADLNNTCQQQYNDCMDQFCMVVDANQKRCSCSENLAKYAKVQQAVEDANAELNDVAQNIRYLGLSADEIHAIMNATEAELELSKTKDSSQTRSMLDDIADMIKDPTSSKSSSLISDTNSLLDMDFDFSSDSSDLFGLDLFSTSSNDISSKRGKDLYKEATKRCKAVLTQCKDAGATEEQISGNYDLAISKDCATYEQGLVNLNQKLLSNVRSANLMLQKGRLSVLQNKNQYDIRGCVGALENCMLDDMVCGEGYLKCLDPTKKYMDENGNVVLGGDISQITDFMANYDNSQINAEFIQSARGDTNCQNGNGACIVNYLMTKIGTGQSFKDGGLCRAVLDKCQDYTYENTGKKVTYKPYNDVVVSYIQRAMINIRSAQAKLISDYASTCLADISECYNQQISQINSLSTTANINSVHAVIKGACYNVALTCGYAVFANNPDITTPEEYIANVSELFYQSLLCPNNSTFNASSIGTPSPNRTKSGWVNTNCQCNTGYTVWGGACVPSCNVDEYRNTLGACVACTSGFLNGASVTGTVSHEEDDRSQNNVSLEIEPSSCSGCPDNSTYVTSNSPADEDRTIEGFVIAQCQCDSGQTVWQGSCVPSCDADKYRDNNGICQSCPSDAVLTYGDRNNKEANGCQ